MEPWKIILIVLAVLFLPAIIFKIWDPKKLGDKIDAATKKMQEKTKQKIAEGHTK
jgi:hypothetical protein